jgi:hypothetical protein
MARRERSKENYLEFQDNISDSVLGLFFRTPTTKEQQAFINKRAIRTGKKHVDNTAANRVAFGKRIITGVREGDFERKVGQDEYKPISSDPSSENYYENWKDWMEDNCADVLTVLAARVFEVPVSVVQTEEDDEDLGKE